MEREWQNWDNPNIAKIIDDFWAESGDEIQFRKAIAEDIKSKMGLGAQILEVGCGSGRIAEELLKAGIVTPESYLGGDISLEMLHLAKTRLPGMRFEMMDILKLETMPQDNVISIQVVQHLPHYWDAVRELMRVARKRLYLIGCFVITDNDSIAFGEFDGNLPGNKFYGNYYSLSGLIEFLQGKWGPIIQGIDTYRFKSGTHSICVNFK